MALSSQLIPQGYAVLIFHPVIDVHVIQKLCRVPPLCTNIIDVSCM